MPSRSRHKFFPGLSRGWFAVLVLLPLLAWPYRAEEVILHLRNGDRISGRLVSESTNAVVLGTGFAENLSIPKSMVERRESVPGPTNKPPATPQPGPAPATGVVSELVLTNKPTMTQAAGGAKQPEAQPKPPEPSQFRKFLSEWRGEAQLGANLGFSTKDREAFTGHMKLVQNHKFPSTERDLRNILEYDVSYGKTDGVLSDNRMEGSWKAEYDLGKRFLIYNAATAGYDEIRNIDLQYDFGPGLGYKWVVLTNFVFKTELGGDYQEQYFAHDKQTSRYAVRLAEDLWWQITPKIRFDEKVELFPGLDRFGNYRVRTEGNLSYLLKENLTFTLNIIDQYDTAVPTGVSENDLQVRSLLGIKF